MSWHRVDPRFLRQHQPDGVTLAFVSHGELDLGQLVLHLDRAGRVVRFELAFTPFLGAGEHWAGWDATTGLQIGAVDASSHAASPAPRVKGAATVRRYRQPPTEIVQALLAYVREHADVLEPAHRASVIAALADAADGG